MRNLVNNKMDNTIDRFLPINDIDIDAFLSSTENANTIRKTKYDISLLMKFLQEQTSFHVSGPEKLSADDLNDVLCIFFV